MRNYSIRIPEGRDDKQGLPDLRSFLVMCVIRKRESSPAPEDRFETMCSPSMAAGRPVRNRRDL